jgi:hypothetical protein
MKRIIRGISLILVLLIASLYAAASGTLEVSIAEVKETERGITVTVNFDNSTNDKFSFGWVGSEAYITLSTDNYTGSIDMSSPGDRILPGLSSFSYLFRDAEGEPEEIYITGIMPLNLNGLPNTTINNGEFIHEILDSFIFDSSNIPQKITGLPKSGNGNDASEGSGNSPDDRTNKNIPKNKNNVDSDDIMAEYKDTIESMLETVGTITNSSLKIFNVIPYIFAIIIIVALFIIICVIYLIFVNNRLKQKSGDVIDSPSYETVEVLIAELLRSKFSFAWQANTRQVIRNAYESAHLSSVIADEQKEHLKKLCYKKGVMSNITVSVRTNTNNGNTNPSPDNNTTSNNDSNGSDSFAETILLDPDKLGKAAIQSSLREEYQNLIDLAANETSDEFEINTLRAFVLSCRNFVAYYVNSYFADNHIPILKMNRDYAEMINNSRKYWIFPSRGMLKIIDRAGKKDDIDMLHWIRMRGNNNAHPEFEDQYIPITKNEAILIAEYCEALFKCYYA